MSPNVPMQRPAPASSFHATVTRRFNTLTQRKGGPIEVRVNGDVVKPGEHSAEVLALLGIVPDEIDDAFWRFVGQGHWPLIEYGTTDMFDEYAAQNQQGAGWQIEASVSAGKGVEEVRDLAYVDAREVKRMLTLTVRDWNKINYATYAENGFDGSKGRTSTLTSQTQPIEPGGAVGSWYSGIDAEEIAATRKAANAIESARRNLQRAWDEMEIAIRVADGAWQGERAEAMKYKFCLEALAVEAVGEVAHAWEDFTQDVVRQQGLAKEHDDKLKREIATEVGITIVVGIITFGAGAVIKGSLFAAKMAKWARDVDLLRKAMQSHHGQTLTRIARHTGVVRALRASRLGAVEVGATVGVKGATGQPLTAEELLQRFAFAAGIQAGSDLWRFGLGPIGNRFGISFKPPAPRKPATGTPPPRTGTGTPTPLPTRRPTGGSPRSTDGTAPGTGRGTGTGTGTGTPRGTGTGPSGPVRNGSTPTTGGRTRVPLRDSNGDIRGFTTHPPGTPQPLTGRYPAEGTTFPVTPAMMTLVRRYATASGRQRTILSSQLGDRGALEYLRNIAGNPNLNWLRPTGPRDIQRLVAQSNAGQPWDRVVLYENRNVTDLVWHDGRTLHIVEAKGGDSPFGTRASRAVNEGMRRSQGSPFTPLDVANDMMRSRIADGRNQVGRIIEESYRDQVVRYVSVRTGDRQALLAGNPEIVVENVLREPMVPGSGTAGAGGSPGQVVLVP